MSETDPSPRALSADRAATDRSEAPPWGQARFDLIIAADWSAASVPGPGRPTEDRCWLAHAWSEQVVGRRPAPEYFRTRAACLHRFLDLIEGHPDARVLLALDFPFGYPRTPAGRDVLPTGRALCALMHELLHDADDDANNRFDVAGELNRRVRAATGAAAGPFWGHPAGRTYADLTPTRPKGNLGVSEYRHCDLLVRGTLRKQIQSPWKLAYPASVGSQVITGLAAVHRILEHPALRQRCLLWPFESPPCATRAANPPSVALQPAPADCCVVIAEIWPGLFPFEHVPHPIKDARQVVATRDAMMGLHSRCLNIPALGHESTPPHLSEGWIVGLSEALAIAGRASQPGSP